MFNKIKKWFVKDTYLEDGFDWVGSDSTMVPSEWQNAANEMTVSEALEEILRRLDVIEEKIDKL